MKTHKLPLPLLALTLCSLNLNASESEFSVTVGLGGKHDSNLSIVELDQSVSKSDSAVTANAEIDYKYERNKLGFKAGYSYSLSDYTTYDQFDANTHIANVESSYDFGAVKAGLTYRYIDAGLNSRDFLTIDQVSPFISGFFSKKVYARVAYLYEDKDFAGRVDRDTVVDAMTGDVYYFIKGLKSYVSVGYKFEQENANAGRYDYDSHRIKIKYTHQIPAFGKNTKLRLGARYELREYDVFEPVAGNGKRSDDRFKYEITYEIPLTEKLGLEFEADYSDNQSNQLSADYSQYVISTRLEYEF